MSDARATEVLAYFTKTTELTGLEQPARR